MEEVASGHAVAKLKDGLACQQVHQESGRHVEAFLQLQQLRQVAPRYPGLSQLMLEAAQAAMGSKERGCNRGRHRVRTIVEIYLSAEH